LKAAENASHFPPMNIHPGAHAFDRAAAAYERARPTYPVEAIDWICEAVPLYAGDLVVDLAAGTGKLTRLLVERGLDVVAVEPVAGMRTVLADRVPQARAVEGTAEAIPLPDASARAVTVAQAFHWFDPERAPVEIARVLEPDGALVIMANIRDKHDPLQAQLEELMGRYRGDYPNPNWPERWDDNPLFVPEYREFRHEQLLDTETFVERVASVSWIASLPREENASVLAATRALVADVEEPIRMPYITEVRVCRRRR
jgi:ubiquinone/menaquinone biosynthesis C-methylase UbiE